METLRFECDANGVGRLRFARAHRRNAISVQMLEELLELFVELRHHADLRALVISGEGDTFCSGLDLRDVERMRAWLDESGSGDLDPTAKGIRRTQEIVLELEGLPCPTIAAIAGDAVGGGCELALACDLRVVSPGTRLRLPEVTLGLVPDWGATHRLPRLIGLAKAKELVLLGETIDGSRAAQLGLATQLVDDAQLHDAADALALRLAQRPAHALSEARRLLNDAFDIPLRDGLAAEASAQSRCFALS